MAHWGGKEKGKTEKEWNLELHLVSHARNNGIATTKAAKHCIYIYISKIIIITVQVARFCVALVPKDNSLSKSKLFICFLLPDICLCVISVHRFPHFVNNGLIFHISLFSCPILRFCTAIQGRVNASESVIICYVPWLMW